MNPEIKSIFDKFFFSNAWHGSESVSGNGSSMASTEAIRKRIPEIMHEFNLNSMFDIPCGDYHWIQSLDIKNYIGADIVSSLIHDLRTLYPNKDFRWLDITSDPLPCADIILCRDCLVHLPFSEIAMAIKNIIESGSKYLLTTTFPMLNYNDDPHDMGRWRPLNLEKEPFNFPKPIELVSENTTSNKYLGLWLISDLGKIYE